MIQKVCDYCEEVIPSSEIGFAIKKQQDGYYCEICEYYHYFEEDKERPKYKLFLEQSSQQEDLRILQKPNIKLSKRLSPLRYPGGKTKLVDFTYFELLHSNRNKLFSPFAGGASIELSMLEAGVVDSIVLNDLDKHLMNFYHSIFYRTDEFIQYIQDNPLSIELYYIAHNIVLEDFELNKDYTSVEMAFYYLINNRCSFSGIYKAGRMGGKNGDLKSLSSRWNAKNIINRIKRLGKLSNKIELTNVHYQEFIENYAWENGVFIIDPPYIEKAQDIYRHAFDYNEHKKLFQTINSFWHSHPNCDFFIFYDEHPYLYSLEIPDNVEVLARKYSIAN